MIYKVIEANQAYILEELLFNYVDKNALHDAMNVEEALGEMSQSIENGDSLVFVDDVDSPTCFYWGVILRKPLLFNKFNEMITMAGWADSDDVAKDLIKTAQRKAKMKGLDQFFLADIGKGIPFANVIDDSLDVFEKIYLKKL